MSFLHTEIRNEEQVVEQFYCAGLMMLLVDDYVATTGPAVAGTYGCARRRCIHLLKIRKAA